MGEQKVMRKGHPADKAKNPKCRHGKSCCPHSTKGKYTQGSPNVDADNCPLVRVGDEFAHDDKCCDSNKGTAAKGSTKVTCNNRPVHRDKDRTKHCGGDGKGDGGCPKVLAGP